MSQNQPAFDDDLDLFTLWDSKWKIIVTTFVATLIGIVFSIIKPNTFEVTTPIQNASQSVFLPYTSLNSLLKEQGLLFDKDKNKNGYKFDSDSVFEMFIVEFNDYEEMIDVLKKNDFVKNLVKDLDKVQKERLLINLAKSFSIVPTDKKKNNWVLKFYWHDVYDGIQLFNSAIEQTLINIQKSSKNNIDELAKAIDIKNSHQLERLNKQLEIIELKQSLKDKKILQYLNEQYTIAKALGIGESNLKSNKPQLSVLLGEDSINVAYYLRGYKAIDKEINVIKNRTLVERLLASPKYIKIKTNIINIENDLTSTQLKTSSKLIEIDNPKNWVEFDLTLSDSISRKNPIIYVTISILLGGLVGVVYVIISNAFCNRKDKFSTN